MADFTVYCLEGRSFPISMAERERLMAAMGTKKGMFRWTDDAGNQIVLDKIISIEVDEYEFSGRRGINVDKPVEKKAVEVEATEDSPDHELEEKRKEMLEELMAKSSCKHDNKVLYYQVTKTGKGVSNRYFPVCEFCGQRFRFVKAEDLTDEEKDAALEWVES